MLPIESVLESIKNYEKEKGRKPQLKYIISWLEIAEKQEQKIIMQAWADGWRERDSRNSSSADIDEQLNYYNSLVVGF